MFHDFIHKIVICKTKSDGKRRPVYHIIEYELTLDEIRSDNWFIRIYDNNFAPYYSMYINVVAIK